MTAKILIVDDDDATRGGLTELLRHAGYDPRPFGTFAEARTALASEAHDLLISDLRLDGFNGLQLVALSPRPVPTIIVTGYPDRVLEGEARRLGAEYLVKPVMPATLLRLVRQRLTEGQQPAADGSERTRRWVRKALARPIQARVEDQAAHVLDVSYGGVRFTTMAAGPDVLPTTVRLEWPSPPLAIALDLVWTSRAGDGTWICGAAVAAGHDLQWRRLVDGVA
jgi:DNA-binding response OmpR family regulator